MARTMILMEKAGAQMNVPDEKLQEYLNTGWKEISRTSTNDPEPADESEQGLDDGSEEETGEEPEEEEPTE